LASQAAESGRLQPDTPDRSGAVFAQHVALVAIQVFKAWLRRLNGIGPKV